MESGSQKKVCLRRNYCVWCFKGKLGKSNGVWVPEGSECIDAVQFMHTKHNGLLPLDMANPGVSISQSSHRCSLVCLVCGLSILGGLDARFNDLKELIESFRMEWLEFQSEVEEGHMRFLAASLEKSLNTRMQKSFSRFGAVWVSQWERLVHIGCASRTACDCAVPMGETTCKRHKKGLKISLKQNLKKRKALETTAQNQSRATPPADLPEGLAKTKTPVAVVGKIGMITKATWLNPLSSTAKCVGSGTSVLGASAKSKPKPKINKTKPVPCRPSWDSKREAPLVSSAAPDKSKKGATQKPNLKLQDAAKGCQFKMDSWAASPLPDILNKTGENGGAKTTGRFSMEEHLKHFDPYIHGYTEGRDGRKWYIRGDGVRVEAKCGVNELTEDGKLLPLC
jgi:hypothetical protein